MLNRFQAVIVDRNLLKTSYQKEKSCFSKP